jgi:hypothetical protein
MVFNFIAPIVTLSRQLRIVMKAHFILHNSIRLRVRFRFANKNR